MMRALPLSLVVAGLVLATSPAGAEVTRVDVKTRTAIGATGYEKIVGTAHFAVDPRDPHNRVIADIDKAPVNAEGRVEFSSDIYIVRPTDPARSNGVAFLDVVNRGNKTIMRFSRVDASAGDGEGTEPVACPAAPAATRRGEEFADAAALGDGYLTASGYTLVFVGWQFDIRRTGRAMTIDVPRAKGTTGIVRAEFTPCDAREAQTVADLRGYPAVDPNGSDTVLTVREGPFGTATVVPRERYVIDGAAVRMAGGFEKGRTYQISYKTVDPPIIGLGLAAFRDVAAWLKHADDAPVRARYAYAFGSSQSGRFLRAFLYDGFNTDEHGRQVLDAVMAHIAGAARLNINERLGTPNALSMFIGTRFPFAASSQRDPITGKVDGLLENDRARANQPKIFFTNSSVEYWGGGRSAALIHTTPDGKADLAPPANVRIYYLAGTQHSPGRFPPKTVAGQQPVNPVDYWLVLRALLESMDNWVRKGVEPPASQYPRLADGTLVPRDKLAFPAIPGVRSPHTIAAARQDGHELPLLVPQVDADGNDRAGVRLPDITVPLATYTGWNFRNPAIGAPEQLVDLTGSALVFPKSGSDAAAVHDPRRPIADRYRSKDAYLAQVRTAAADLVRQRYLLERDVPAVLDRAAAMWQFTTQSVLGGESAVH
jgi:hypothetical protein